MPPGDPAEQGEVGRWLNSERWDGHQPRERQRRCANRIDQAPDLVDGTAALLLLLTDVHLDVEPGEAVRFLGFLEQRIEQGSPIERMDRVEQLHRLRRLVRLQPADAVKPYVGMVREKRRPFLCRLLDAVLAEVALAGSDQGLDLFGRAALADRDQPDVGGI